MPFVDIVTMLLVAAILACSVLTVRYLRRADQACALPKSIATPSIVLNGSVDELAEHVAKVKKAMGAAHHAR
ncbi:hypothetical protein ACFRAQ_35990 [Nocardia sp. NPDC056611]|uniref:hypothetical protein n=1 Tax=Nocardia sp. NPDC056611 TaxID=3345877 RepID=UPI00366E8DD7